MANKKPVIMSYDGSKSNSSFDLALKHMFEAGKLKTVTTVIETCGGALGILPAFYPEFYSHIKKYVLSDYDDDIIHLYKDIIHRPKALKEKCNEFVMKLKTQFGSRMNDKVTEEFKNEIFTRITTSSSVKTLFNHAANRSKTLTLEKQIERFLQRTKMISEINAFLFRAYVPDSLPQPERDLIKILKRFKSEPETLFLVDPPYYLTKVYDENTPDYEYHEKILSTLLKVKGYFALFFRINASREHNSKNNDVLDNALFQFYKDHLYGKGLYVYCDDFSAGKMFINFRNRGTYEVIVTNFEYQNTHPLEEVIDEYEIQIQLERQSKPITTIAQELGIED